MAVAVHSFPFYFLIARRWVEAVRAYCTFAPSIPIGYSRPREALAFLDIWNLEFNIGRFEMRKKLIRMSRSLRGDTKFRLQTPKRETCLNAAGVDVQVKVSTRRDRRQGIWSPLHLVMRLHKSHSVMKPFASFFLYHVDFNYGQRLSRFVWPKTDLL